MAITAKITKINNDSSNASIVFTYEVYDGEILKLTETVNVHSTSTDVNEVKETIKKRIKQRYDLKSEEEASKLKEEVQKLVGKSFTLDDAKEISLIPAEK